MTDHTVCDVTGNNWFEQDQEIQPYLHHKPSFKIIIRHFFSKVPLCTLSRLSTWDKKLQICGAASTTIPMTAQGTNNWIFAFPFCLNHTSRASHHRTRGGGWWMHSTFSSTAGNAIGCNSCAAGKRDPTAARNRGTVPARSHLLGLLGEGLCGSHHHAGAGLLVLGQVDAGDPLRGKRAVSAGPGARSAPPPSRRLPAPRPAPARRAPSSWTWSTARTGTPGPLYRRTPAPCPPQPCSPLATCRPPGNAAQHSPALPTARRRLRMRSGARSCRGRAPPASESSGEGPACAHPSGGLCYCPRGRWEGSFIN